MKTWTVVAFSLISLSSIAADYSVPEEHWQFMDGYKYDYPNCSVAWSGRTATFLISGDGCGSISPEKMKKDALRSIDYVKKNSSASNFFDYYTLTERVSEPYSAHEANQDAQGIWESGCSDFKNGLNDGDFPKWLKLDAAISKYPKIKKTPVINLYTGGWDTARLMKGVINCKDFAPRRAKDYVSGIDIRNGH